jgi:FtsX-like permease family
VFRRSFLLRRMGSAWLLVGCLMLSVLVTTTLVSALLSFYDGALPAAVAQELSRSGALSVAISDEINGPLTGVDRFVSKTIQTGLGNVPYRQYQALWSEDMAIPGAPANADVPEIQAATMSDITSFARLTAGTWPAAPTAGRPVGVALPAAVVAALGLRVGSELHLHYTGTKTGVRLQVTGVFRPLSASSPYWRLSQIGPSGVEIGDGFATYGPAVVSPAAFTALQASQVGFVVAPSGAGIRPGDLSSLAAKLSAAVAVLNGKGINVSTRLPQALANAAESLTAARSLVLISGLQLLLLAAAALALAGRLLASQRDDETALLAARGAARWQLIRPSLTEGALACVVAAAAGAVVGVRLSGLLLGTLVGHRLSAPAVGLGTWLATALVLVFCLGIAVWPALRPAGVAAVRVRRGRQAAVATAAAAGLDIALIALAAVAVRELLTYSAGAGGSGLDPVVIAAPALALAGLALVPLRLLPFAAKGLEKLTARGRQLGTAMANWEISRRPVRQSGPALLVILAVGMSTLALAQYQSWRQSVRDQAAFTAGAQVTVSLPNAEPMTAVSHLTRLPGVTAAMPVITQPLSSGELLAIGGRQAGAIVTMRRDLAAPLVPSQLWRGITEGAQPGLVLPGRPERLAVTASMAGGLNDQLGPVSAVVTVQDAYGLAYTFPVGTMPADGRPHQLVAQFGSSAGSAYPLRLIGLSLTYNTPLWTKSVVARAAEARATVTVSAVAASNRQRGPFGPPFASGRELAGWRPRTVGAGLGRLSVFLQGQSDGTVQPSVLHWTAAGRAARLTLNPGMGPQQTKQTLRKLGVTRLPAQVEITIPPPQQGVRVITTGGYLRATDLPPGSVTLLTVGGVQVPAHPVLNVSQFPSVTSGDAVVVDGGLLQDAIVSAGGTPLPATSWWFRTSTGAPPPGLPPGSSVVDAASLASSLEHDPISAAPVKAALAVAAAVALLAVLGFCVSVAASARARRGQRALLAALGVPADAQARLFCLEEILISAPAAAVGLAVGVGLAHLLIPAVTLTATGGLPMPPVLVRLPLTWVVLMAVAVAALPVVAAAVSALRQPDPAAELRAAEAAG